MPRYFSPPPIDPQREVVYPNKIQSGALPGSTVIRIGGDENVKIDGINRTISATLAGGTVSLGNIGGSGIPGISISDGTTTLMEITKDGIKIITDAGIPLALFGRLPDGTIGIVIAKEGYDVTTLF